MSEKENDAHEELYIAENDTKGEMEDDALVNEPKNMDVDKEKYTYMQPYQQSDRVLEQEACVINQPSDETEENPMPSLQEEEQVIKKKYGGLLQKKPPLISKDHERAFFDSADWALNKQGSQKSKGPLEALRPKLQPSPQQHLRAKSAYARLENISVDDDENETEVLSKDQRS